MKRTIYSAALLAALSLPTFAGTDMAPMASHDGKDMKDAKQMAKSESDAGFYVAAYGGAQFYTNYGNDRESINASGADVAESTEKLHSRWGGVGGLKAGYNFNSMPLCNFMDLRLQPAVEAEALYIGLDDTHATGVFGPGINSHFSSNSGDFFANGILRFKNSSMVTPYIGVGAGLQYITTHGTLEGGLNPGAATGLNTANLDFAAQALLGFDVAVCKHVSIFTEYKFIDALGEDGHASLSGASTYRLKPDQIEQNLITAGVKYSF